MIRTTLTVLATVALISLGFYARGMTTQPEFESVRYDEAGFNQLLKETAQHVNLPPKVKS